MFRLSKTTFALSSVLLVLLATTAVDAQYSTTQNRDDFHNGVRDGQSGGNYSQSPRHSYDRNGYDQYGYDRNGYNQDGYNPSGYNRNGQRNYQTSTPNPSDRNGYSQNGYDQNGYNRDGYDQNGRDRNGRTQADTRGNRYGDQTYPGRTNQGGIGPGKGALIGGAGGAILGALFGGGLKGTIIGGAAGAGIGAVVGQEHQSSVRRRNGDYARQ